MLRSRHHDQEHGQVVVLFALALVVILGFASMVIDLGVLRNNRQILANTMDAAALAGGTMLPTDSSNAAQATALINQTIQANYPGLPSSSYKIEYKCLIGVNATNQPYISRDVPLACNPSKALGHTPVAGDFIGAGATRVSACDPRLGDLCNAVEVSGNAMTPFSLGRVVGVPQGWTGLVESASCSGSCGASPVTPVDVVLIMDRTLSMSSQDISDIQSGANSVLSVLDPAIQRVALGTIGPSLPAKNACPSSSTSPVRNLPSPANRVYGVGMSPASNVNFFNYPGDLAKWIPVGFTGLDGTSPPVAFNEAYSTNGVTNTSSTIWEAVSCLYSYTTGTNLDTPISMAQRYLTTDGRPGVRKGIILETDGTPQAGDGSAHYTCNASNNTATIAKAAGIEIFTIGFGIGSAACPTKSGAVCPGSTGTNSNETAAWSCKPASQLLRSMATDASHFYDAPDSATLISAFTQAAVSLATGKAHLVQLYPTPIVSGLSPATGTDLGGTTVTISGKCFTGATAVQFGGAMATFTVTSDTSITATAPAGSTGSTVDIMVTTPGGLSPITSADRYTYN